MDTRSVALHANTLSRMALRIFDPPIRRRSAKPGRTGTLTLPTCQSLPRSPRKSLSWTRTGTLCQRRRLPPSECVKSHHSASITDTQTQKKKADDDDGADDAEEKPKKKRAVSVRAQCDLQ